MSTARHNKTVKLSGLLASCGDRLRLFSGPAESMVSSIEYNSACVKPGSIFIAVEGFASDGHRYVHDAVAGGASAVLVSRERAGEFANLQEKGVSLLVADDMRKALSRLSAAYYGFPTAAIPVIGITGTNGKTSITYMLESIFSACGRSPGVIGTVNYRWKGRKVPAPNTTPESKDLQELAAEMRRDGVDVLIMEVSSHGLKLNRVDDIEFDIGVFTNLTRDHLDFHKTFEDYFKSKRRLFTLIEACPKLNKAGIINGDDDYGRAILEHAGEYSYPLEGFAVNHDAVYRPRPESIVNSIEGIRYVLERPFSGTEIALSVSGRFHVYNSLCALAAAHRAGAEIENIKKGLSSIHVIPGRFDGIRSHRGFYTIVDYAHTNDALEKLLLSARELSPRRLITVFGCGGDRDKTKRPLMGDAASRLSDWIIVTSDNPRTEKPDGIISDILAGIKGTNFEVEPDREKAIGKAIASAEEGDIVVIAGKGHEDYQIVGREKRHFDDREMVRKFIAQREAS